MRRARSRSAGYRYDLYSAVDIAEFLRAYGTLFQDWFIGDFGKPGYPEGVPHVTSYARNFTMWRIHEEGIDSLLLTGGTLQAEGPGAELIPGQTISIKITLGAKRLGLEYRVKNKQATPLTESMTVPFPMNIQKATFRLGQVGSTIDPARDIAEGANRELWCVDRWMDVSDNRIGLAVMPRDMPLVSIGDVGIYRFEPDRVPKSRWCTRTSPIRSGARTSRSGWKGISPSGSISNITQATGELPNCGSTHSAFMPGT